MGGAARERERERERERVRRAVPFSTLAETCISLQSLSFGRQWAVQRERERHTDRQRQTDS